MYREASNALKGRGSVIHLQQFLRKCESVTRAIKLSSASRNHPAESVKTGCGQRESDIYLLSTVPAAGLRGRYFMPTTTGVG